MLALGVSCASSMVIAHFFSLEWSQIIVYSQPLYDSTRTKFPWIRPYPRRMSNNMRGITLSGLRDIVRLTNPSWSDGEIDTLQSPYELSSRTYD